MLPSTLKMIACTDKGGEGRINGNSHLPICGREHGGGGTLATGSYRATDEPTSLIPGLPSDVKLPCIQVSPAAQTSSTPHVSCLGGPTELFIAVEI